MQQRETGSRGTTSHAGSGHSSGQADPPAEQTTTAPRCRQYNLSDLETDVPEAQSLLQGYTPPAAQSDIFAGEIQTTARCRDTKNSCSLGESNPARNETSSLYGGIIGACDEIPPDMIQSFLEGFAQWRDAVELCECFPDQTEETDDRLAAALSYYRLSGIDDIFSLAK